jgi:hypothetical protein
MAMEFLVVLVFERERARTSKGLEGRGVGERLGAPKAFIYGTDEEIVVGDRGAYPKQFGKWRDSFDRMVAKSFEIHAESYSVCLVKIRLCCGWVVFGSSAVMVRIAE